MNPLELFKDDQITDVLINSTSNIQLVKNGELISINQKFESELGLREFARELIVSSGSRLDISKPYAEIKKESSYGPLRVHALLGDECSLGTQLSIRRHPKTFYSLVDLLKKQFINDEQLTQLREIVLSRRNFVIAGATGSGKTTLLKAMLEEVRNERIITIEDATELFITDSVSLFTRENNQEGVGAITLEQLIRQALRMRPDRIVIGEARGSELALLLQTLNTGHTGSGFTLHANNKLEVVPRMLGMLMQAGVTPAISRILIASSVDYVIELSNAKSRAVLAIAKLDIS